MSFLDFDFSDVVEPHAVDPDKEYKLRILDVRQADDKNGNPYVMPRFEIMDETGAKDFTYFMGLPNESMDAKRKNTVLYRIKMFLEAFDLSPDTDPSEWVGAEGWAILGREDNDQYGEQNFVKKFVKG